jgi:enamine deaminase RidA (YjgF/YER057c/UK114 family)
VRPSTRRRFILHRAPARSGRPTGSRLAFVAGQAAIDRDFTNVGVDDLEAQTRRVMTNLDHARDEDGRHDAVDRLRDDRAGAEQGNVRRRAAGAGVAGVTSHALAELLIEIELVVSPP